MEIKDLGTVKLFVYTDGSRMKTNVFRAIEWIKNKMNIQTPVVLLAGDVDIHHWEFGEVSHTIPIGSGWQKEIVDTFKELVPSKDLMSRFKGLSEEVLPNDRDLQMVADLAREEYDKIHQKHIISRVGVQIAQSDQVRWVEKEGKVVLDFKLEDPAVMKYFFLKFLIHADWARELEKTLTFHFSEKLDPRGDGIPVLDTSSFKGLEAEGVIVVSKGQSYAYLNEWYVACSRAKKVLAIVIDKANERFYFP